MRILTIRGKNLASLAGEFEVPLNSGPLEKAGLFAITGQTGAGKSTILDALCLALYDKIPRLPEGRGFAVGHKDEDKNLCVTSNDVRSILRRGTSHGYAEVDFIGKDKLHYRARWEVSRTRGKADSRLQPQDVTLINIKNNQRIGQGKKNTLESISGLVDLNFDQFRRSVLLAQGDFAAFLKAKKDERSSLLEQITGTELYSRLSIAAFDRAKQEKDKLSSITGRMQDQLPLDKSARSLLEQHRDQSIAQLVDLENKITDNQKIIGWYAESKKLQKTEQEARDALAISQQAWDQSEHGRQLMQKVEAAQPLRPLLGQYGTARAEHQEAQQKLNACIDNQLEAETKLLDSKEQLSLLESSLLMAEQQRQEAQPLLINARALDTRIDVARQAVGLLTNEEHQLKDALDSAKQDHQALLSQQEKQTQALHQLNVWIQQNQQLKPIAEEWNRWDAELERYQTLNARKTSAELNEDKLRPLVANDDLSLTGLMQVLADSHDKTEQYRQSLVQMKKQEGQHSLEQLHLLKEGLETKHGQVIQALGLANNALELQQTITQDADKQASTELLINKKAVQLQALNQRLKTNGIALGEAKKALELMQATTHKSAKQFRSLLQDEQPCPVCGALEHPWKNQASVGNEQATAQSARVNELENQKAMLIKTIAEEGKGIGLAQEQQAGLATELEQAQAKLAQCINNWAAIAMQDKPVFSITDALLLPALILQDQKINSDLGQAKQQEKAALELQKQIQAAQNLFDAAKMEQERVLAQHAGLEKQLAKNKADLEHVVADINELELQLQTIIGLLLKPFRHIENWQPFLCSFAAEFRQDYAAKVQQFQHTKEQIEAASKLLEKISHDEKLAEMAVKQCFQQYQARLAELNAQTETLQKLLAERNAVLPLGATADSYEQTINQNVQGARAAHQQAGIAAGQAETDLVTNQQNQRHWQAETQRRFVNLENAQNALNSSLERQGIDLEELNLLLKKNEAWLAEQKTQMAALERTLQESAALLKVKADDCQKHAGNPADMPEDAAIGLSTQLHQQKQAITSQKEEQIILLREDDKKTAAGLLLKIELDSQQERWEQWQSLNGLIGSSSGAKFRTFAQSLTLEALLSHSNRHLEDFARRYALQRVPGSDLELQIVDHDMADDVRSIHSLSGGESFLVSLALALGLASLSSNKTQVESLFIDEGFGSLDPETLDVAIASLDSLQALGRKVGIISHVPILVERIGAKVVVEKQGGGRSSIVVVGGH